MEVSKEKITLMTGGVAAVVSGVIHIYLTVLMGLTPLGLSFLFAGLGFFIGIALFYMDYRRKILCFLGLPFVSGQIFLWYWINRIPLSMLLTGRPVLDVVDKLAQLVLLIVLVYYLVEER